MKIILPALAALLSAMPAHAAEIVPAPAIGIGLPAIAAVLLACLITLLLKHTRV